MSKESKTARKSRAEPVKLDPNAGFVRHLVMLPSGRKRLEWRPVE